MKDFCASNLGIIGIGSKLFSFKVVIVEYFSCSYSLARDVFVYFFNDGYKRQVRQPSHDFENCFLLENYFLI